MDHFLGGRGVHPLPLEPPSLATILSTWFVDDPFEPSFSSENFWETGLDAVRKKKLSDK